MKYIRTKECVITEKRYNKMIIDYAEQGFDYTKTHPILKESEDVEDLFDVCILKRNKVDGNVECLIQSRGCNFLKAAAIYSDKDVICEIFGAIWTNWGLKYVAKLSKKERWSLI